MSAPPLVALVGRPNVGKSTLFNRYAGGRRALVENAPGVTRDRIVQEVEAAGRRILLVDTAGFCSDAGASGMDAAVQEQVRAALAGADAILFVVDGQSGLLPEEIDLSRRLRRSGKPTAVAVNKIDVPAHQERLLEFHALGIDMLFAVSAEHGGGAWDALEALVAMLPDAGDAEDADAKGEGGGDDSTDDNANDEAAAATEGASAEDADVDSTDDNAADVVDDVERPAPGAVQADVDADTADANAGANAQMDADATSDVDAAAHVDTQVGADATSDVDAQADAQADAQVNVDAQADAQAGPLRVALVGRPNVGKSSLLNRLLGETRMVVADSPGTTRDAVDAELEYRGRRIVLVDTAGMRRAVKRSERVERGSAFFALRALERADTALVLVDAAEGINDQDMRVLSLARERGAATAVLLNKWDLVKQHEDPDFEKRLEEEVKMRLRAMPDTPLLRLSALSGMGVSRVPPLCVELGAAAMLRIPTAELNRWLRESSDRHQPAQAPRAGRRRPLKFFYAAQTGVRPPAFALFCSDPGAVQTSYLRFLENRLRERFPLAGAPVRLHLRKRRPA